MRSSTARGRFNPRIRPSSGGPSRKCSFRRHAVLLGAREKPQHEPDAGLHAGGRGAGQGAGIGAEEDAVGVAHEEVPGAVAVARQVVEQLDPRREVETDALSGSAAAVRL
jgi:hypothetical protein